LLHAPHRSRRTAPHFLLPLSRIFPRLSNSRVNVWGLGMGHTWHWEKGNWWDYSFPCPYWVLAAGSPGMTSGSSSSSSRKRGYW
jgi:hypothetical protein